MRRYPETRGDARRNSRYAETHPSRSAGNSLRALGAESRRESRRRRRPARDRRGRARRRQRRADKPLCYMSNKPPCYLSNKPTVLFKPAERLPPSTAPGRCLLSQAIRVQGAVLLCYLSNNCYLFAISSHRCPRRSRVGSHVAGPLFVLAPGCVTQSNCLKSRGLQKAPGGGGLQKAPFRPWPTAARPPAGPLRGHGRRVCVASRGPRPFIPSSPAGPKAAAPRRL